MVIVMENILGVIEDLLDKYDRGSPEEKEDSLNSLKLDKEQFLKNLAPLVEASNAHAQKIQERLQNLTL